MNKQKESFFEKRGIRILDIMYMTRSDRKTILHLVDGNTLETFHSLKNLVDSAPLCSFDIVNKGVALAPRYIARLEKNVYTMTDGSTFRGRVHSAKHKNTLGTGVYSNERSWMQFEVLDKAPLPFCVIELVFDAKGHGIDFIFRYCNKAMENLEKKPLGQMINKSFYEVFENGDRKWLVTYADVAINGVTRVIESFSPEIGQNLKIYCFQPRPNFCACALIEV